MTAPHWRLLGSGRLVVRLPNWLGDALFAVPTLRALRAAAPAARIELLARPAIAEVLGALAPLGDAVVAGGRASVAGVLADRRALRGAAAALLLPNSFGSALAPFLARVPIRVGSARDGRRALLSHPRPWPAEGHQAAVYRQIAGFSADFPGREARVEATPEALERGRALVGPGSCAALVPGAAYGPAKQWGAARFAELGNRLRARGIEPLVLGAPAERELGEEVARGCRARSLAGRTDGAELVGVLAAATVVVANDSGALHLAAALGTATIGVFGATLPEATGPVTGRTRVVYQRVPCSPCGRRACNQPSHACMERIGPEWVERAVLELLATAEAAAGGAR